MNIINKCNTKGITLISLVLTIVIMLILATVSVNLILGNNGIFNKTKISKEEYQKEAGKELLSTKLNDFQMACVSDLNKEATLENLESTNYFNNDSEIKSITYEKDETSNEYLNANVELENYNYIYKVNRNFGISIAGEKNNEEDITIQNSNFKAIEVGSTKSINTLYSSLNNKTFKYNENNINDFSSLPVGEYNLNTNNDVVNIKTSIKSNNKEIADLSGNNYNGTLTNGAEVKKDENNDYYINLDGVDDYVNIGTLPSTINWKDGFTLEFEARWDALNNWSRIFETGNGPNSDNVLFGNYANSNSIGIGVINGSTNTGIQENVGLIDLGVKNKYKLVFVKNVSKYDISIYKNDVLRYTCSSTQLYRNVERTKSYIGKDNWNTTNYFKGRIYSLNITQTDGTKIISYNLNETNASNDSQDTQYKLAVIGTNYSRNIADISGNNYNAELIGTTIKKDEDNKYYFDLDGSDDYINICTLPSTINWQDGFTVEFEARWDALYDWSRIFEAANGPNSDNIIIANFGTTNSIGIGIINGSTNEGYQENIGLINIGEKNKYKLEFIKNDNNINYTFKIYKDNILKYTGTSNHLLRNLDRVNNYIGKSNWSSNKYFKGRIYNLNIYEANGKKILNYDINEWVK